MKTTVSVSIVGLILLCIFLQACAVVSEYNSVPVADAYYETASFGDAVVSDLFEIVNPANTLFVFDIDNTLLEAPAGQLFGSDQWYKWQRGLPEGSPEKVECLLQMQGAAYYMAHLIATEAGGANRFVRKVQSMGFDAIALTARSPIFRPSTSRELNRNGIDFSVSTPGGNQGFPGQYLPRRSRDIPEPRDASYQQGIAMLAGQHKGAALIDLLQRLGVSRRYGLIVFFDDDSKNTKAMLSAFDSDARAALVFLYSGADTNFDQYDLEQTLEKQKLVAESFAQFARVQGCDI